MDRAALARSASRQEHIALHRLWVCANQQDKLNIWEHAHLVNCDDCLRAFEACLTAENFGQVLKELSQESGAHHGSRLSKESE
ncbi:MAG TPA: hypothetical protein VFR18_10975 [Terriglobia bacterium]|nr:hypothetical protein [Terriglobia bacterium]